MNTLIAENLVARFFIRHLSVYRLDGVRVWLLGAI